MAESSKLILKDKDANKFIKNVYEINQIIKKIYKNLPNFKPIYYLTNSYALYIDQDCIPEIILYKINKPLCDFNFGITIDSKEFYELFKESLNVNTIIIEENKISFDNNEFINNKDNLLDKYKEYLSLIGDLLIEGDVNPDLINFILNEKPKELIHLAVGSSDIFQPNLYLYDEFIEMNKNNLINEDNTSYLEVFLNKKFILGANYKIKKLKSGDKIEYTPIHFKLSSSNNNEDYYELSLFVKLKNNDVIEHHFMICDF